MVHWLTMFFVLAAVCYMLCQSGSECGAPFTVSYLYWVHVAMLLCSHTAQVERHCDVCDVCDVCDAENGLCNYVTTMAKSL